MHLRCWNDEHNASRKLFFQHMQTLQDIIVTEETKTGVRNLNLPRLSPFYTASRHPHVIASVQGA
jgi:hypothetical protein